MTPYNEDGSPDPIPLDDTRELLLWCRRHNIPVVPSSADTASTLVFPHKLIGIDHVPEVVDEILRERGEEVVDLLLEDLEIRMDQFFTLSAMFQGRTPQEADDGLGEWTKYWDEAEQARRDRSR